MMGDLNSGGAMPDGPGCQPTASAANASSQSGITIAPGAEPLRCNFCGKSQHDVRKLIAGPRVFICNECVALCDDIVREDAGSIAWNEFLPRLEAFTQQHKLTPTLGLLGEMAWVFGFDPDFALKPRAQGIEAPSGGETGTGSTEGESPVDSADAPKGASHD